MKICTKGVKDCKYLKGANKCGLRKKWCVNQKEPTEMPIGEIKKSMLAYTDLFGRNLIDYSSIKNATTKEELANMIDGHNDHIESSANDAQSSLARYKTSLGLNNL